MSYKTNAKALRLGISQDWSFKAHGPQENLHLDQKLSQFITNLIEHVVPQAPQRTKTKGKYIKKFATSPGVQGKTIVLRGSTHILLIIFFYLNYDGADQTQRENLQRNFSNLVWLLKQESGYNVQIRPLNYFIYFWRMNLFTGRNMYPRLRFRINRCIRMHGFLQAEQIYYAYHAGMVRHTRHSISPWKRERYVTRSFYPIVAAFLSEDFDADMAAKAIALELQILRIYHKRFMKYVKKMLWMGFYYWNQSKLIEGLKMEVNGRMTDFRRQIQRAQTKVIRFGTMQKSSFRVQASHCRYIAYNRYGVISVSITYQQRPVIDEKWEDRNAQSPLRAFSIRETLELFADEENNILPENFSLYYKNYKNNTNNLPNTQFNKYPIKKTIQEQPGIELINKLFYSKERFNKYLSLYYKPDKQRPIIAKQTYLDLKKTYTKPDLFPIKRAELRRFQFQISKLQFINNKFVSKIKKKKIYQLFKNQKTTTIKINNQNVYYKNTKLSAQFNTKNRIPEKISSKKTYLWQYYLFRKNLNESDFINQSLLE